MAGLSEDDFAAMQRAKAAKKRTRLGGLSGEVAQVESTEKKDKDKERKQGQAEIEAAKLRREQEEAERKAQIEAAKLQREQEEAERKAEIKEAERRREQEGVERKAQTAEQALASPLGKRTRSDEEKKTELSKPDASQIQSLKRQRAQKRRQAVEDEETPEQQPTEPQPETAEQALAAAASPRKRKQATENTGPKGLSHDEPTPSQSPKRSKTIPEEEEKEEEEETVSIPESAVPVQEAPAEPQEPPSPETEELKEEQEDKPLVLEESKEEGLEDLELSNGDGASTEASTEAGAGAGGSLSMQEDEPPSEQERLLAATTRILENSDIDKLSIRQLRAQLANEFSRDAVKRHREALDNHIADEVNRLTSSSKPQAQPQEQPRQEEKAVDTAVAVSATEEQLRKQVDELKAELRKLEGSSEDAKKLTEKLGDCEKRLEREQAKREKERKEQQLGASEREAKLKYDLEECDKQLSRLGLENNKKLSQSDKELKEAQHKLQEQEQNRAITEAGYEREKNEAKAKIDANEAEAEELRGQISDLTVKVADLMGQLDGEKKQKKAVEDRQQEQSNKESDLQKQLNKVTEEYAQLEKSWKGQADVIAKLAKTHADEKKAWELEGKRLLDQTEQKYQAELNKQYAIIDGTEKELKASQGRVQELQQSLDRVNAVLSRPVQAPPPPPPQPQVQPQPQPQPAPAVPVPVPDVAAALAAAVDEKNALLEQINLLRREIEQKNAASGSKDVQLSTAISERDEKQRKLQLVAGKFDQAAQRIVELNNEIESRDKQIQRLGDQLVEKNSEIKSLGDQIAGLRAADRTQVEAKVREVKTGAEKQIRTLQQENKQKFDEFERQKLQFEEQKKAREAERNNTVQNQEQQLAFVRKQVNDLVHELGVRDGQLRQVYEANQRLGQEANVRINVLEQREQQATSKLEQCDKENRDLRGKLEDGERQFNGVNDQLAFERQRTRVLETQIHDCQREIGELRAAVEVTQRNLATANQQNAELQRQAEAKQEHPEDKDDPSSMQIDIRKSRFIELVWKLNKSTAVLQAPQNGDASAAITLKAPANANVLFGVLQRLFQQQQTGIVKELVEKMVEVADDLFDQTRSLYDMCRYLTYFTQRRMQGLPAIASEETRNFVVALEERSPGLDGAPQRGLSLKYFKDLLEPTDRSRVKSVYWDLRGYAQSVETGAAFYTGRDRWKMAYASLDEISTNTKKSTFAVDDPTFAVQEQIAQVKSLVNEGQTAKLFVAFLGVNFQSLAALQVCCRDPEISADIAWFLIEHGAYRGTVPLSEQLTGMLLGGSQRQRALVEEIIYIHQNVLPGLKDKGKEKDKEKEKSTAINRQPENTRNSYCYDMIAAALMMRSTRRVEGGPEYAYTSRMMAVMSDAKHINGNPDNLFWFRHSDEKMHGPFALVFARGQQLFNQAKPEHKTALTAWFAEITEQIRKTDWICTFLMTQLYHNEQFVLGLFYLSGILYDPESHDITLHRLLHPSMHGIGGLLLFLLMHGFALKSNQSDKQSEVWRSMVAALNAMLKGRQYIEFVPRIAEIIRQGVADLK